MPSEFLDKIEAKGKAEGKQKGEKRGRVIGKAKGILGCIRNLKESSNCSSEQAMELLGQTLDDVLNLTFAVTDYYMMETGKETSEKEPIKTMDDVIDRIEARARSIGEVEGEVAGREEGEKSGTFICVCNLMKKANISAEEAMNKLYVPRPDREEYLNQLNLEQS